MKTRKLSFAIIAMAIAAITVAVVSCKKEKQEQITNKMEQNAQSSENMDEYLISFKEKLLSAQKGDESISIEQAQADLGNLLNFDFGDANYASNVYEYDTLYIPLETIGNSVDILQLAKAYNEAFVAIVKAYPKVDLPEKSVYCITCNILESSSKDSDSDNVEVVVVYRGYNENTSNEDTEGWRPKNKGGTCSGELIGIWGAPEVVSSMLNNNAGEYACANGSRIYFTDTWTSYTNPIAEDLSDPNSPCGHRLYLSWQSNQNYVCLPMSECVYYYNQARYLKSEREYFNNYPSNHLPLHCTIRHTDACYGTCQPPMLPYIWILEVKHGKPNCSGTNPTPEI